MYIFTIILRFLGQDKLKFFFLSVCLALGMLIGTMFVCQAYEAWYSYFNYKESIDYERIVVVQVEDKEFKFNENTDLYASIKAINDVAPYRNYVTNLITYNQNLISGVTVIGTNNEFQRIFRRHDLIEGEWIESENDCVIGKKLAEQYHINIGDRIVINNYHYHVVGINRISNYNKHIFIDENVGSKRFDYISVFDNSTYAAGFHNSQQPQFYYVFFNEKVTQDNINELKDFISEKYKIGNIRLGKELIMQQKRLLFSGWGMSVILSLISLSYGVININNIEKFYFMKRKQMYGILLAHGATIKQLFKAIYFEIGIISLISSIILYVGTYLLSLSKVNDRVVMRVDLPVFVFLLLLGQIYSLIYSWFNTKALQKQAIRTLF